jgi:hypothetical protein
MSSKDICQRTFSLGLALKVVKLCQYLDLQPGILRTLGKQILRSGTSVGANVEEAQAAQSKADFVSKMNRVAVHPTAKLEKSHRSWRNRLPNRQELN